MVQNYEVEFLKNVFKEAGRRVGRKLDEEGEVVSKELLETVYRTVKENGLVEGDLYEVGSDAHMLTDRVYSEIEEKFCLERHDGVEDQYITREEDRLSRETAEDVAWREHIVRDVESYLDSALTEDWDYEEFSETVSEYVLEETRLSEISEDVVIPLTGIISDISERRGVERTRTCNDTWGEALDNAF